MQSLFGNNPISNLSMRLFRFSQRFSPLNAMTLLRAKEPQTMKVTFKYVDTEEWSIVVLPTAPSPTLSEKDSTSITFDDQAPALTEDREVDTVTFPPMLYMLPSQTNGTWRTSSLNALAHPIETFSAWKQSINNGIAMCNWKNFSQVLATLAEETSHTLTDEINEAMKDHDAVEIGNRVVDLIPKVSLPTSNQLSRAVDALSDTVQDVVQRKSSASTFLDKELDGDQWAFARLMSAKARQKLVSKKICGQYQVECTRANTQWQTELNNALASTFAKIKTTKEYNSLDLFDMKPVWKADHARKVWQLKLDTGDIIVEQIRDGRGEDVAKSENILLTTGFGLPEHCGRQAIPRPVRNLVVEDDWLVL